ncbi:MAG: LamG-like jellyroll fold domain-containing protein [Gemmatimonadota bacterium]
MVGSGGIDLVWMDNSVDEDGFAIERRLGQTGTFAEIAQVGADVTTYSDVGLIPETEYCYQVRAFNAGGNSGYTNISCATTEAAPPPPPPGPVPTEGLRVHLVADDLEPLVGDGGRVASWPNRGSEGGAVQEKGNRRPTFHAGAVDFGGHGHVGFNEGADDDEVLEITGVASHGSGTLIAVFSQEDVGSHNYGIFAPYGSSTSRAGFVTQRDLGSGGPIAYWDPTNGWKSSGFRVQAGEVHVAVWRIEGSVAIDFQVDGVDQATAVVGSDMRGPFDRYLVGMTEPSTVSRFDGQIAELLFYDRKVTDAERDQIVGSLIETYGVGAPPPPPPPPHLPPRRRAVW